MTDIKLLSLLLDYFRSHLHVTCLMLWAIEDLERGKEQNSFAQLFLWCEAKEEREEIWKRLAPYYFKAILLQEGV